MSVDVVDYDIFGNDMQYVEIELAPGEAGMMMFMQDGASMKTVFGEGSVLGSLGKRLDGDRSEWGIWVTPVTQMSSALRMLARSNCS